MGKRKICVFTGTRAEYGLLKPLIDELKKEKSVESQLIISGMHLSPEFGLTAEEIDIDGFSKVEKVEILLSSDTSVGVSKAMGLGMISYSEVLERLRPELLIGLGDRFELFSIVSAALVNSIPVAHIHGGELTFGAYDDSFRHAITKMSHLHFTSTEEYRKRVIQLGEDPKNVFNVGAIGLDNIKKMKLLSKSELEESLSFKLDKPFFVVTYHPETLHRHSAGNHMKELLHALDYFKDYKIIFTKPNADNGGHEISRLTDNYIKKNQNRTKVFESLGQLRYLSALNHAHMVIGNSSSGIIEMPGFKKPTVNIGDRQKGRIFPLSIIQCEPNEKAIVEAVEKGLDKRFRKVCRSDMNIYGNGTAAIKIKEVIVSRNLTNIIKKNFYDINRNDFAKLHEGNTKQHKALL